MGFPEFQFQQMLANSFKSLLPKKHKEIIKEKFFDPKTKLTNSVEILWIIFLLSIDKIYRLGMFLL